MVPGCFRFGVCGGVGEGSAFCPSHVVLTRHVLPVPLCARGRCWSFEGVFQLEVQCKIRVCWFFPCFRTPRRAREMFLRRRSDARAGRPRYASCSTKDFFSIFDDLPGCTTVPRTVSKRKVAGAVLFCGIGDHLIIPLFSLPQSLASFSPWSRLCRTTRRWLTHGRAYWSPSSTSNSPPRHLCWVPLPTRPTQTHRREGRFGGTTCGRRPILSGVVTCSDRTPKVRSISLIPFLPPTFSPLSPLSLLPLSSS
jgi:hypothetical protein